jgi:hypothetical protein
MTTHRASFVAGLAIFAMVAFSAVSTSAVQAAGPVQSAAAPNGFPAARCSRTADQESLRIKQLIEFVEKSRAMAAQNPMLLADVGYYEAELSASRRCLQAMAAK